MNILYKSRRVYALIGAAALIAGLAAPAAAAAPNWSDKNIAYTRGFIAQSLTMLSHDDHDYAGHRVAAIADLNSVNANLQAALRYDANHDRAADTRVLMPRTTQTWERGQSASNQNIQAVDSYLQSAATMLQQDQRDYGGYRVKAIAGIESARSQLSAAMSYFNSNARDLGSDRNMRYARWYIERGIDQLQNDQRDYNGHRVAAITDMQQARQDILSGLHADAGDPRYAAVAPPGANTSQTYMRNQNGSNENLEYVRNMANHAATMLSRDNTDYNGYRARAITALNQAQSQLSAALASAGETGHR